MATSASYEVETPSTGFTSAPGSTNGIEPLGGASLLPTNAKVASGSMNLLMSQAEAHLSRCGSWRVAQSKDYTFAAFALKKA